MNYLRRRVLQSGLKLEQVSITQVIEEIENRIGRDNCTISWAIENSDEKVNVSFHAGLSYLEILQHLAQSFGYILLHADDKSSNGKQIVYLSFMKQIENKD